jgi:GNAT superfamily N-acetyltransferase
MKEKNQASLTKKIIIRRFIHDDSHDLIKAGFKYGYRVLYPSFYDKLLRATKLAPRKINLVAYHIESSHVIGFISIVLHTASLCSIRNVFLDPTFRRRGVATRLMNHALILAKKRGVKKVCLTSYPLSPATKLYRKLGFRQIVKTYIVRGQGCTSNFPIENDDPLIALSRHSQRTKNLIFNIFRRSMGKEWVDFFGSNGVNLFNGHLHNFGRFFSKSLFVNDSNTSFAIIYRLPLLHTATVELYGLSDSSFPAMFKSIMKILNRRGITYSTVFLFNVESKECKDLLNEYQFYPYQAIYMGRRL